MKQIRFTHTGHSNALGNFEAGDLARVDDAMADHFVRDAMCAEYVEQVQQLAQDAQHSNVEQVEQQEAKPVKTKKGAK